MEIEELINIYSFAIENLPEDYSEAITFLRRRHLEAGICYYTMFRFGQMSVDLKNFVDEKLDETNYEPDNSYWCITPSECNTRDKMLESLKFRLKILQSWNKTEH